MRAWEEFLQEQIPILGEATVNKWLRPLKIVKFDAGNLYLEVDYFQKTWFEEYIKPKLKNFCNNNANPINVHLIVKEENAEKKVQTELKTSYNIHSDELDPSMVFETFSPIKKNEVAFNFLKNLSDGNANIDSCNPIFIFGEHESGKTHLLHSLAHAFLKKNLKVMFIKTESFTSHVVNAIRMTMMDKFREIYRSCDVLIIDDIHILANKHATQEEFFHTFNTLHIQKKQIILSSNIAPRQIENIEDRLISRFEWGIPLKIQKLEKSDLKHLIILKDKYFHLHLQLEAIDFLHDTFQTINPLQKALKALVLRLHMNNINKNTLTVDDIKCYLKDLLIIEHKETITFEKILTSCANHFNLSQENILSKSQTQEHAYPRQIAMYFCRNYLNLSYPKIGQLFKRDHSTVMTSIKIIQKKMEEKNDKTLSSISEIKKNL